MEYKLYPLGKIIKTHGYNGVLVLVSDSCLDDKSENLNEVFLVIDGLHVPFPVRELVLISDTLAHVKLEFADDQNEAIKLVGCGVYVDKPLCRRKIQSELERWVGFTVNDSIYGKVGVVKKVENYRGNVVMQVMDGKKEILISMYPELVTSIDEIAKKLFISAPNGYFLCNK